MGMEKDGAPSRRQNAYSEKKFTIISCSIEAPLIKWHKNVKKREEEASWLSEPGGPLLFFIGFGGRRDKFGLAG